MDPDKLQAFLLAAPVLLFSMVAHEYAHGYAALRHGDDTAYKLGRLTWNPLRHIDPVMTVLVPMASFFLWGFIFGGAKPIPVNTRNFRHFRRADITVSLAGVATNLVLAFVAALLIVLLGALGRAAPAASESLSIFQVMMTHGVLFNLVLCVFNLLPLPPLDGSHVIKHVLPAKWAFEYLKVARYGFVVLMALLYFAPGVIRAWLTPAFLLSRALLGAASPFVLESPWTTS